MLNVENSDDRFRRLDTTSECNGLRRVQTARPSQYDSMSLSSFKFQWWAPKHVYNVKEYVMTIQGQFKVNR